MTHNEPALAQPGTLLLCQPAMLSWVKDENFYQDLKAAQKTVKLIGQW